MVFEEVNSTKNRAELKNIVIGKPLEEQRDYNVAEDEQFQEYQVEGEDLDEEERQFLKEMMGNNIDDLKEMEDDENPEQIERHYEVGEVSDAPIEIEEETVELDQETSLDFEHAPEGKMTEEGKKFLLEQLFGSGAVEDEKQNDEEFDDNFMQEVQNGLNFFNKKVEIHKPESKDFKQHIQQIQELSDASDLQFQQEEQQEDELEDELETQENDTFKNRKQKKERVIALEDVVQNKLTQEDIDAYKLLLEGETAEEAENKLQEYMRANTIMMVHQETLEDTLQSKKLMQKRFVNESAMITLTKTGVPQNVFKTKAPKEEEPGAEYVKVVMPHNRPKDETEEQRRERKQLVKDAKKLRKEQKAEFKEQFKQQKAEIVKGQMRQRANLQGRKID